MNRDSGIEILLVDDREENIRALKAILADPSYTLVTATSGKEALSHVLKHDFALILLDVYMGTMDGYEVASLIKGSKRSRHVPIIFLTAMAKDVAHVFKAYSLGAIDFIQKPLEPHTVKAKVAVFAELYRNKQEIKRQAEVIRKKELREKEFELLEAKRAGEKRFHDLAEGIDHGMVWSADPTNLTFSYVSPRAELILGYPLEQWTKEQRFWEKHLHPEDRDFVLDVFRKAQMGRDIGIDHRFITQEGSEVWLHTGVRLARKGEGVGYELRGLSVDITHLKRVESALKEAVQVRDEFLQIASHELKTPITPLKLQVAQLQKMIQKQGTVEIDRLSKFVDLWNRQLDRMALLVEDLLDVSRISAGRLTIHCEQTDLVELIREVAERFKEECVRVKCEILLSLPEEVIGDWDRLRIEQVFTNLIANAIKYAPAKPIRVTLSTRDNRAFLSVRDQGMGISKENQSRIFGRFERAVSARQYGGLGLGLYISRQIVEAHHGGIRVESEPGNGANFVVDLPLKQDEAHKLKETA